MPERDRKLFIIIIIIKDRVEINKQQYGFMPGKETTDVMCCLKNVNGKVQGRSKRATLCIRGPRESLRQGFERRAVVLYEKIRNGVKVYGICTGYIRGKQNSGEVCSRNCRKFQDQDRIALGISVKSVSVCCDYGQANGRSKERTTMDEAVC